MLSRSGDIRGQSRTLQKIDGNFACFWPLKFFREGPPTCPTLAGDSSQIAIMWQSFAVIGRGASEMWLPIKTSAVKQKPVRNYRSGRPKNRPVFDEVMAEILQTFFRTRCIKVYQPLHSTTSLFCNPLLAPEDIQYSQAREKQMPIRFETTFLNVLLTAGMGSILWKFGGDPAICLREEAICAKVYRRTDRQTDGRTDDGRLAIV